MGGRAFRLRIDRLGARFVAGAGALGFTAALGSCTGAVPPAPEVVPAVAAAKVTFGTLQGLGSFVFQSSTRDERTNVHGAVVRESALSLKWRDRDEWEYQSIRDGKMATHWLVFGGRAFEGLSGDDLRPKGDPEPLRAQLALGWDSWEDIVAITEGRVTYGPGVEEMVGGRPTIRHKLSLTPVPEGRPRSGRAVGEALEPASLTGTVWIDKQTSVRVLADATVVAESPKTYVIAPDGTSAPTGEPPTRTRTLAVKLAVTGLGEDPGVAAPIASPETSTPPENTLVSP